MEMRLVHKYIIFSIISMFFMYVLISSAVNFEQTQEQDEEEEDTIEEKSIEEIQILCFNKCKGFLDC